MREFRERYGVTEDKHPQSLTTAKQHAVKYQVAWLNQYKSMKVITEVIVC